MDIGVFHPQIVHFVIALLLVGVLFRVLSLVPIPRAGFLNASAAALLLMGTAAAVVAVRSGDDAHGVAERIPGARDAVVEHEEYGEKTRNIFLGVAAIEILALVLAGRAVAGTPGGAVRLLRGASAALGLVGAFYLYETGEHGGAIVYEYAGGVGTRSGNPEDVDRLLVAALYQNAQQARRSGDGAEAARFFSELARARPTDAASQILAADSRLRDLNDAAGALAALDSVALPADNPRVEIQAGYLRADALLALGQPDSARAVLQVLADRNPQNTRIAAKRDSIPR